MQEPAVYSAFKTNRATIIEKYNNINKFGLKSKRETVSDIHD